MRRQFIFLIALLAVAAAGRLRAQAWSRDTAFAPVLVNEASANLGLSLVSMADGHVLVRGDFTHLDGRAAAGLARLRPDGAADSTFTAGLVPGETVLSIAPLPDGRALAVRQKITPGTGYSYAIVRLLSDGALDAAYPPVAIIGSARLMALPGGGVLAWGGFTTIGTSPRNSLARFNPDGTLDAAYAPTLSDRPLLFGSLAADAAGKLYVSATSAPSSGRTIFYFVRLLADGSIDLAFKPTTPSATYRTLAVQPDGKLLAAGTPSGPIFAVVPDPIVLRVFGSLVRFLPDGANDPSFQPPFSNEVQTIAALPDGRIAVQVVGYPPITTTPAPPTGIIAPPGPVLSTVQHTTVLVLTASGAVERDLRSAIGGGNDVQLLGAQSDGRLLVRYGPPFVTYGPLVTPIDPIGIVPVPVGPTASSGDTQGATTDIVTPSAALARGTLARIPATGGTAETLPAIFVKRSGASIGRVASDAAGRVTAWGNFTSIDGQSRPGLARFLASGALDASFVPAARPDTADRTLQIVQPDGKVILRESVLGAPDADGFRRYEYRVARLLPDGRDDATFAPAVELADYQTRWHAATADGRVLVSCFTPDSNREENLQLVWLGADGRRAVTLPTTFGGLQAMTSIAPADITADQATPAVSNAGLYGNPFSSVQLLPDGRLLASGEFSSVNGAPRFGLARLQADGALDAGFAPDLSLFYPRPSATLLSDGRLLVAGPSFATGREVTLARRLLADGSRDPAFADLTLVAGSTFHWTSEGLPDLNFPARTTLADGRTFVASNYVFAGDGSLWTGAGERFVPREFVGITVPPLAQTIVAGRDAFLQVAVGTTRPATCQWLFNGAPLAGAQGPLLPFATIRTAQAGSYQVRVTIEGQVFTSVPVTLAVTPNTARLMNFSARSRVAPGSSQIVGLVTQAGAVRPVLLRAVGLGLAPLNVIGVLLPDPVLGFYEQVSGSPVRLQLLAENHGGGQVPSIATFAAKVGAFPLAFPPPYFFPSASVGSALAVALGGGTFIAQTTSGDARAGVSLFELYDGGVAADPPLLRNASVRGRTAPGGDMLIVGFSIAGNGPLQILLRGVGPTLASFGISDVVTDPRLAIFRGRFSPGFGVTNDDWAGDAAVAAAALRAGAFPLAAGSRDAALLLTLEPGAYTLQISGAGSSSGEALAEIYVIGRD